MEDEIKVFYNKQIKSFKKRNNFMKFKQDCFIEFNILDQENFIFYIKMNNLIIQINEQKDYSDMIIKDLNTPDIYILNKDLFLIKNQINNIKEEIDTIKNNIEQYKQKINNCKKKINENEHMLEEYKKKTNEKLQYLEKDIENLKIYESFNNSSLLYSRNKFLSSLHKIKLKVININIPEINRNRIQDYYYVKIKVINEGPIAIPAKTYLSIIERSAFKTSNEYINNGNEIDKDQNVNITFKLVLNDKNLLIEGFNIIKMKLCNEEFAGFGNPFTINIAYI